MPDPGAFRAALLDVDPKKRDEWVDRALGLGELPDDGDDLPRDCVLPCSVDAIVRMVDRAPIRSSDVFVDLGSGLGRSAALVHLLTGAATFGVEIQQQLANASRERVTTIAGDASASVGREAPRGASARSVVVDRRNSAFVFASAS